MYAKCRHCSACIVKQNIKHESLVKFIQDLPQGIELASAKKLVLK